jgi:tetratricopeptide (TPR) repeat protein
MVLVFLAAFTLLAGQPATGHYSVAAVQGRNTITGYVYDSARRPVPNIRVELLDDVNSMIGGSITNSSGRYSFNNLSTGTFQVRVLPSGDYLGQTIRVQIQSLSIGASRSAGGAQTEHIDIVLQLRAGSLGAAPGSTFAQQVPKPAEDAYRTAVESLNSNKTDQGISELKRAVELFPTYYAALERLGWEMVKLQQYEQALESLKKAVEVNPKGDTSLYALGVALYNLKRWPEATDSLRRSLSLAPDSPNIAFLHMYLGIALVRQNKADDAEPHLKQAHERGGKVVPDVHMHLAQIYSNRKLYKEAADELEVFLKETPNARDSENIKNIIKQLRAKAK